MPRSFLDRQWLVIAMFVVALMSPMILIVAIGDDLPAWLLGFVACLIPVPAFLGLFALVRLVDDVRGAKRPKGSDLTVSGVLIGQAVAFFYLPLSLFGAGEDGEAPILEGSVFGLILPLAGAAACVVADYRYKKRRTKAQELSILAEDHPEMATKFLARTDRKSWSEIEPKNVLAYQSAFESALKALNVDEADMKLPESEL